MVRACLGLPGRPCGRLSKRTRCPDCTRAFQRQRDQARGTAAERGYNGEYTRNRRDVLADGPHPCAWGCGRLATTVDHRIPLSRGGSNDRDNLMPSCLTCNSSRGSRMDWSPPRW